MLCQNAFVSKKDNLSFLFIVFIFPTHRLKSRIIIIYLWKTKNRVPLLDVQSKCVLSLFRPRHVPLGPWASMPKDKLSLR